jgi:pimeloyl-ACP methyl ester carboxylesterase
MPRIQSRANCARGKLQLRKRSAYATLLLATGLAGEIVVTYSAYRRDIGRAYRRISTGSEIVQTPVGTIEYAVAGEGLPLLSVHGAGGGFDQGLEGAEPLTRSGFRVVAPSRFGYLRTPLPSDASAAAQADSHACLLDALAIERAAIIGTSAGAPSSMQFALRHPDRTAALVLLVPAAYAPASTAQSRRATRSTLFLLETALRSDFLFWVMGKLAHDTLIRSILGTPPKIVASASADEQARIERIIELILPVRPRRLGLLNDGVVVSSLPRYELEKISAPTLAISAADCLYGTFEGARYAADHIPGARFVGYPNGGHMLVGHLADASAKIVAFLRQAGRF